MKRQRNRKDVDPDGELKNKKMNNDVYKLRREVMKYIYEAKNIVPTLPRITIRITDNYENILGKALLAKDVIWIPDYTLTSGHDLRTVVFHEILHAVYNTDHHDDCPMMKPSHSKTEKLSKAEAHRLFKKWATEE